MLSDSSDMIVRTESLNAFYKWIAYSFELPISK